MNDTQWMNRSKPVDRLDVGIAFLLDGSFYTGDPNDRAQLVDPAYREPLALPDFLPHGEREVSSTAAVGHEAALAAHYRHVLERAAHFGKPYHEIAHHFWMRMSFTSTDGEVRASFPWYDTLTEMSALIEWLEHAPDADTFHDIEQGWAFEACLNQARVYLRESDPDSDAEYANVVTLRAPLVDAATRAERDARAVIASLTEQLGTDVWTAYRREAHFGTASWQPGPLPAGIPSHGDHVATNAASGPGGWLTRWFKR